MRTTILIGYAKTDGSGNPLGAATVVSGPPENDSARIAQGKLFHDAKFGHKFPKGVKALAFCTVDQADFAAHISDDLGQQIEARETNRIASIAEQLEKADAKKNAQGRLDEAQAAIGKAAVAHNNANAALVTAKSRLLDAEANYKVTKTESHKSELEAAKEKVLELTKSVADTSEALQAAKQAKADLVAAPLANKPAPIADEIQTGTAPEGAEKKGLFQKVGDLLAGK